YGHRKAFGVRPRTPRRILRSSGHSPDRSRCCGARLSLVFIDCGNRQEPHILDAYRAERSGKLIGAHMNFLTSKTLPRRTMLRGMGATLALPFLEAMLPLFVGSARAAAKPVNRFLAFYTPNGMAMEYWTPKGEGTAFELSPILEPLAPFRDQVIALSGLHASW